MTEQHSMCCGRKVSWTAIFAGAFVGIGLNCLLNLFSIAISLSAFNVTQGSILMIGGVIGIAIEVIVAMFLAGLTAGYLGRFYAGHHQLGILYGFLTWSVTLILISLVLLPIGRYVGMYASFIINPVMMSGTPQSLMSANAQTAAMPAIGIFAFIVFILFALGAISSCVGAHFGLSWKQDNEM
jgi:hypothetical protein